jgi:hypothetical protein
VLQTETSDDARIIRVFRLFTRRPPRQGELAPMRAYYDAQRRYYSSDLAAARELVSVGVTPVETNVNVADLAALTNLAAAVMNSPDAYTLR